MIFYRVESSFSTIDAYSKVEQVNIGPYMGMGSVIEAVNVTHRKTGSSLFVDENKVVHDTFYSSTDDHPSPDYLQAELFWKDASYVCGFDSLDKLRRWFGNYDLKVLETTHFMIVKYKFDGRKKSEWKSNHYQDVFNLKSSEMVGFIDIKDLLNA